MSETAGQRESPIVLVLVVVLILEKRCLQDRCRKPEESSRRLNSSVLGERWEKIRGIEDEDDDDDEDEDENDEHLAS